MARIRLIFSADGCASNTDLLWLWKQAVEENLDKQCHYAILIAKMFPRKQHTVKGNEREE